MRSQRRAHSEEERAGMHATAGEAGQKCDGRTPAPSAAWLLFNQSKSAKRISEVSGLKS